MVIKSRARHNVTCKANAGNDSTTLCATTLCITIRSDLFVDFVIAVLEVVQVGQWCHGRARLVHQHLFAILILIFAPLIILCLSYVVVGGGSRVTVLGCQEKRGGIREERIGNHAHEYTHTRIHTRTHTYHA